MIHREDAEQKALIQWADIERMPHGLMLEAGAKIGHYLFAIPNGGARGRTEAARLVGLGVRSGVPDLFFSFPSQGRHGLYIEMKAPKPHGSQVTKNQNTWIERMYLAGYGANVCYGFEEARTAIIKYMQ